MTIEQIDALPVTALRLYCYGLEKQRDDLESVCELRALQIRKMVAWLDVNQQDVWSRGMWQAMNEAIEESRTKP